MIEGRIYRFNHFFVAVGLQHVTTIYLRQYHGAKTQQPMSYHFHPLSLIFLYYLHLIVIFLLSFFGNLYKPYILFFHFSVYFLQLEHKEIGCISDKLIKIVLQRDTDPQICMVDCDVV